MFLQSNSEELNTYSILPDLQSSSDHTSLIVNIVSEQKFIQDNCCSTIKSSEEGKSFIEELRIKFGNIDATNIPGSISLEGITQDFATIAACL